MKPFEQATTEELRALWEEKHGTSEIVPAEPLTEPLKSGEIYYFAWGPDVDFTTWKGHFLDTYRLFDKNVFPYTPSGKLGAELRDKTPHPGIHWKEDLNKLNNARKEWEEADFYDEDAEVYLANAVISFVEKYLTE